MNEENQGTKRQFRNTETGEVVWRFRGWKGKFVPVDETQEQKESVFEKRPQHDARLQYLAEQMNTQAQQLLELSRIAMELAIKGAKNGHG